MFQRPHRILVVVTMLILAVGLLSLYSSCCQGGLFVKKDIFHKQLWWICYGVALFFLFSRLDYRRWGFAVAPLYIFSALSLGVVLLVGRVAMGAQRWLNVGDISFQPSEFGKFALILLLANYYSRLAAAVPLAQGAGLSGATARNEGLLGRRGFWFFCAPAAGSNIFSEIIFPLGMTLFLAVPVLLQPDLGSAIVYVFIFFAVAFLAGTSLQYIFALTAAGLAFLPVFWHFLRGYQKSRLLVFLNPNIDPLGAGYTVIQSKIAVGSGQLFGKGWMAGTQGQLNFLAERHTDFIFSVIGEELGFVGSALLLALYGVLIAAILRTAELAKDAFGRLVCAGVAAMLFFHVFVNIAMNAGFSPVVGLPLPFISYGGSSLLINLAAVGIVVNIARQK